MTAVGYRGSLLNYNPVVYIDGERITSVADEPKLRPGINAIGVTYDLALRPEYGGLMLETQESSGKAVNRMIHINRHSEDLLSKLEAVRLVCRESGCAQHYLLPESRCVKRNSSGNFSCRCRR
jgi:4-hydroxybutyryl-CoA dehydratase/vinylacetyl-CoA-Delta-isomerase